MFILCFEYSLGPALSIPWDLTSVEIPDLALTTPSLVNCGIDHPCET